MDVGKTEIILNPCFYDLYSMYLHDKLKISN